MSSSSYCNLGLFAISHKVEGSSSNSTNQPKGVVVPPFPNRELILFLRERKKERKKEREG
jgi:hypothetical protein